MADTADKLSFAGEINVLRADIASHSGQLLDITGIIGDITLYEDLFSNTMSGYILVVDGLDLIDSFPMIGQELLYLELETPTLKTKIKKTFYVYKLQHRTTTKRSQTYVLNFCSLELITSINSKVAKSFSGSISDSVISIFDDTRYLAAETELLVEPTANSLNFIAPFWSPLETINWLANKSLNLKGVPNYLFYETNQTYEFASIDLLLTNEPLREYVYSDVESNTSFGATGDVDAKYNVIEAMNAPDIFDNLRNTAAGMHASTLYTLDTTTKSIRKSNFDYIDDFNKSNHLDEYPLRTQNLLRKKISSIYFIAKNNYLSGKSAPVEYSKIFGQRNSLLEQISAFKFSIKVFGRTDIKVGDTIKIKVPKFRQTTKDEIDDKAISDYFTGKYLITAIRHQIINGKHSMEMEVAKDSFVKQIINTVNV